MIIDAPQKEQTPALGDLWKEAFGDTDEFLNAFERTAFRTERCRCVTVDGKTVAALYWFDCLYMDRRIGYLYAIATAKTHRGQGICHKLMEDTHRHLTDLGYAGAILVPGSKALFEFYRQMDYQMCGGIRALSCAAAEKAVDVRPVSLCEYADLRRCYLPDGGVVQENENLEFLQTMAHFYAGEGFLLVARREADILYGAELLGDAGAAPGIVRALGCAEGRFRTPGTDTPFAMYRALGDSTLAPPSYFGLAFD